MSKSSPSGCQKGERDSDLQLHPISPPAILYAKRLPLLAIVFLVQFVGFSILAFHRLIDSDEGFYLYIPKLMFTQGAVLYRDVFYQQMPLFSHLYSAWMRVFGFSWEAGRLFSAFLAALTGTLLYNHVSKNSKRILWALSALLLYAFNLSMLLFFLTAKTYALSAAMLFGSYLMAVDVEGRRTAWAAVISGLLLALSVQTRLLFAAALPVMVFWFWSRRHPEPSTRPFWLFIVALALGFIPSYIHFAVAPRQFVYDNLFYHGMRDPAGLVGDFAQKLIVARKLVISAGSLRPTQFAFLLFGLPLAFAYWKKLGGAPKLALAMSFALGAASFLPTPTFGQYFCVLIPFLTIVLVESFGSAVGSIPSQIARTGLLAAFVIFSCAYATWSLYRIEPLFFRGEGVEGIVPPTDAFDWTLATIKEISTIIESNADPDSVVVSTWPGYLLTINRRIYPKMENQISVDTSWKLSSEEADRLKMFREEELHHAIADSRVQVVVAGNCTHGRRSLYREITRRNGYRLLARIGHSEIYVRNSLMHSTQADD